VLALARVKHELHADPRAAGLLDAVGAENIFMTLPTAVDGFHRWCTREAAAGAGRPLDAEDG
jgi:SulP family sulfate permease